MYKYHGWRVWTGFIWLRIRTSEHDDKPSGSTGEGEFREQLSVPLTSQEKTLLHGVRLATSIIKYFYKDSVQFPSMYLVLSSFKPVWL
jgi:hypothetical protein